ncbi:MAG: hypothetical protein MUF16_24690 [Burkholderiaceae bacterium]|nr:hypothetical protein [Burkholderiaceae bacterium]
MEPVIHIEYAGQLTLAIDCPGQDQRVYVRLCKPVDKDMPCALSKSGQDKACGRNPAND